MAGACWWDCPKAYGRELCRCHWETGITLGLLSVMAIMPHPSAVKGLLRKFKNAIVLVESGSLYQSFL